MERIKALGPMFNCTNPIIFNNMKLEYMLVGKMMIIHSVHYGSCIFYPKNWRRIEALLKELVSSMEYDVKFINHELRQEAAIVEKLYQTDGRKRFQEIKDLLKTHNVHPEDLFEAGSWLVNAYERGHLSYSQWEMFKIMLREQ
jgi:hypothetical protein